MTQANSILRQPPATPDEPGGPGVVVLNAPYLIYFGDVRKQGYAKTGLGLIYWCPERCVGQMRREGCVVDGGLPDMTIAEAVKSGAKSIVIGVAEAGKTIETRPFQLVTGRNWRGTAFGGAKGRTDVPKIVDMYMTGKIDIDPMITHVMGLEEINTAFDLMHEGKSIRSVVVY